MATCRWVCPLLLAVIVGFFACPLAHAQQAEPSTPKLLFLGDNGIHRPALRFDIISPVFAQRGIELVYTDKVTDLNSEKLAGFDGLILYANIDVIEPQQAQALLDFVAKGKGFIPLHCASYCFRNNEEIVALIGGQFQRHGTGIFRALSSEAGATHPILQGYRSFESFDETYVHTKHNEKDRIVLEYRIEGQSREPWTWVRTHGKGRVFYTAWGHDERTWSNPGFHNLVERGVRWAIGADPSLVPPFVDRPEMKSLAKDVKPFEYVEAKLPFYPAGQRWGTLGEAITKMQKPLPPEESIKHFATPVDFEVQLYAAEPNFEGKPIAMNWDERGRLWVCETIDYPNELQPVGKGRDRIRICEDTDGDHRADKFTLFADKLSIPTAIAFYRGGAIVQDGEHTIYLKDTDGDGRADLRKVLVSGWAMNDTHGGVSNFQYGFDNWYYGMQGYNNSTPVLTDGRQVTSFRQGFFRFKVEGEGESTAVTQLEFLRSTNNNTWGLGFSEEGLVFGSTANGNPSEYLPIPNRYYEKVRGWSAAVLNGIAESNRYEPITNKVRQVDFHGGFTAATGHALYTARAWPREYWNRTAFVTEATGHLVATFVLTPNGTGFRSKNSWNILASDDEWSAPVMAEVGPDGQLWVLDWYNMIVQHNPTPAGYTTGKGNAYETELRDKKHGRVYRVVHTKNGVEPIKGLDADHPEQLVAALRSDNLFWRRHAQRLLVERNLPDVVPQLIEACADTQVDALNLNAGVLHALWTLHGLSALDGMNSEATAAAKSGLTHESPAVRRTAALVLVADPANYVQNVTWAKPWKDPNAHVRLATFLALSEIEPSREAARAIAEAVGSEENLRDPWLLDGLTAAAAAHDYYFLPSLLEVASRGETYSNERCLGIFRRVAHHFARAGETDRLAAFIRDCGSRPGLAVTSAAIEGLSTGWPKDKTIPLDEGTEQAFMSLAEKAPASQRSQIVSLGIRLGSKKLDLYAREIAKSLMATIEDTKASDTSRVAAASQLMEFRKTDIESATRLLDLTNARTPPAVAAGFIESLGQSESVELGGKIVERLAGMTPAARSIAIRQLLSRAEWAAALLSGLESGSANLSDLTLDQKQALSSHPDQQLARRAKQLLAKGGGLPDPDRQKVIEQLAEVVIRTADATKGKEVFKQQCAKCHQHSGEGTRIGPDLTGMAVHPKHELLIHILDPSRSVEGNFRVYTVALSDGRVMTGLLSSESKTAIEIIDSEGKRQVIQREDIDELISSKKSLMPEGFEKQVPPEAIADLLEFLTQRGKYLPIPLNKVANSVTTKGMFFSETGDVERLVFRDWSPKKVGEVPFVLIDPQDGQLPNAIMLYGPQGIIPPRMPRSVTLQCNSPAKAIHLLSGISGWGFPLGEKGSVSVILRVHYADGQTEDHELLNGVHFADYIRRVDVPGSKLAFMLRGQQLRYLAVEPKRDVEIAAIEFEKGPDLTAPIVMAVTVESP